MGHLFQGRYKALLVDADSYLLELVRYIHLNPVRAGLVDDPSTYPWSGHRAYLGEEVLPWLTTEWVLEQLDKRLSLAQKRYAAFVREGMKEGYREELHRGGDDSRVVGTDGFVERVLAGQGQRSGRPAPVLDKLLGWVCRVYGVTEEDLRRVGRRQDWAEARAAAAYSAVVLGSGMLTEMAKHFHRDVATLSTGVRRITTQLKEGKVSERLRTVLEKFQINYRAESSPSS